ncbi:hypothetical protein MAH1_21920 [Sessilibacter sp. MAH1]
MAEIAIKKIKLWDMVGVGLIFLQKSGVIYTNQVAGTACLHPQAEGIFAPIEYDIPLAHPEDTLESKLVYLLCNYNSLPSKKAEN